MLKSFKRVGGEIRGRRVRQKKSGGRQDEREGTEKRERATYNKRKGAARGRRSLDKREMTK